MSSRLDALYRKTNDAYDKALRAQWRRAAAWDFDQFVAWLHGLPLDSNNSLFEVFESLAEGGDVPTSFFVNEIRRLLKLAQTSPREVGVYTPLGALAFLRPERDGYDQPVEEATLQLSSAVPQIRRAAVSILGDLAYLKHTSALAALRASILGDSDWRVRCMAHSALVNLAKEEPAAPPPPQLSLLDRLRQRWESPTGAAAIAA
jgi:hypothetical protein